MYVKNNNSYVNMPVSVLHVNFNGHNINVIMLNLIINMVTVSMIVSLGHSLRRLYFLRSSDMKYSNMLMVLIKS